MVEFILLITIQKLQLGMIQEFQFQVLRKFSIFYFFFMKSLLLEIILVTNPFLFSSFLFYFLNKLDHTKFGFSFLSFCSWFSCPFLPWFHTNILIASQEQGKNFLDFLIKILNHHLISNCNWNFAVIAIIINSNKTKRNYKSLSKISFNFLNFLDFYSTL